ncbi:MAG TPA: hypothetical protein VFL17_09265 [Anaerolineae bacterium]|nr:hypothetical protein [Anaerolineae bacterium]
MVEIGDMNANDVWLLWDGGELVGYAEAKASDAVLTVSDLVMMDEEGAMAAGIVALTRELTEPYVRVTVSRPHDALSLRQAGYRLARPDWSTFMVKPLTPDVTVEDACRLFGIGSDRFFQVRMDTT